MSQKLPEFYNQCGQVVVHVLVWFQILILELVIKVGVVNSGWGGDSDGVAGVGRVGDDCCLLYYIKGTSSSEGVQ